MKEIKTYFLEMNSVQELKEKAPVEGLAIIEAEIKDFQINKFLYGYVGEKWAWFDKHSLTDDEWKEYAQSERLRTWIAYFKGAIAGYYELDRGENGSVEIAYFGLTSKFIGKGFGAYLLSHALRSAWDCCRANRVWVQTCSLDHPYALKNYQDRGMKIFREESNNEK